MSEASKFGHRGPTQFVCVADLLFYGKCTGFAVCFTIYVVVLLPQTWFFERFEGF